MAVVIDCLGYTSKLRSGGCCVISSSIVTSRAPCLYLCRWLLHYRYTSFRAYCGTWFVVDENLLTTSTSVLGGSTVGTT